MSDVSAFYLRNHVSSELLRLSWAELAAREAKPGDPGHPKTHPNKAAFTAFHSTPKTDHVYYSGWEPKDPSQRLTKDNPVARLHAVVADYDAPSLEQSAVDRAIRDCPEEYPVAYVSRTYSGGIRMIWILEKPLPVFSGDLAKLVLGRALKELRLKKLAPALDEGALMDPAKVYELGTDWRAVKTDRRIPAKVAESWVYDLSQKVDWKKEGKSIPLEVIEAEVNRRWPGRWQGPFAVGCKGVRFWDPTSKCETGAWVRDGGIQAFTGEGRYIPWGDPVLLGKDFVKAYEAEKTGGAIEDTWFDGSRYWIKDGDEGIKRPNNADVFRRRLGNCGLSSEKRGEPLSEVDRAQHVVEAKRRVDACFPILYSNRDVVTINHQRYLNVSRAKPLVPAQGTRYWGEGFPWTASFIDGLFDTEQRDILLGWLSHAYQGALQHEARQGHAIFIVGDTGGGKTILNREVVAPLLGGYSDAASVVLGKDQYNGSIFDSPVWSLDDPSVPHDRRGKAAFSEGVKRLVANPAQTYRRMYSDGVTLPWMGRVVVTLNMNGIEILPDIDGDLLEKVIFLLTRKHSVSFTGYKAKLANELPHLGAFLRHHTIPESLVDPQHRFGVREFHHPTLLEEATEDAPSADTKHIVDKWRNEYFLTVDEATAPNWEGTAQDLYDELKKTGSIEKVLGTVARSGTHLGRHLSALCKQGLTWLRKSKGGIRVYTIDRPGSTPILSSTRRRATKVGPPGTEERATQDAQEPGSQESRADGGSRADEILKSAVN